MKVHLIKEKTIDDFARLNARSKSSLEDWIAKMHQADWNEPIDIKNTFRSADILGKGSNRVVFDIAGNNYRIIGKYAFGNKKVHLFICWIGTHGDYDKLCQKNQQYTVNIF